MGKSLAREISISELRTLRDEGLSNAMIARQLDISTATVARYLGKMTSEERGRIMRERNFVSHDAPRMEARQMPEALPVASMFYEIKGDIATYAVDTSIGEISFMLNGKSVSIKSKEVEGLIDELGRVLATINQLNYSMIAMGRG